MNDMNTGDTSVDSGVDSADTGEDYYSGSEGGGDSPGAASELSDALESGDTAAIKAAVKELGDDALDHLVSVKVQGKVQKMPLRDVLSGYQLRQVSDKKMQEAASYKKSVDSQVQQFVNWAKENPDQFLSKTGIDPDEFAEARLAKRLEMMGMSEEQRRAHDLEQENRRFKQQEEERLKEQEAAENARKDAEVAQQLDVIIAKEFEMSGLPKTPYYVKQIAAYMHGAIARGEQLRPGFAKDIVAKRANSEMDVAYKARLDSMSDEDLLSYLGDGVLKRIRKAEIKHVTQKAMPGVSGSRPANRAVTSRTKKDKPLNERGWREYMESLKR
jgi:hypothetical protein